MISSTTEGLEINKRKCIVAQEENGQTSREGVFAGGDAGYRSGNRNSRAIKAGKAGARGIDAYLRANCSGQREN